MFVEQNSSPRDITTRFGFNKMHGNAHFVLLLIPSVIALGLLSVASVTNYWTISLEENLPQHLTLNRSTSDVRLHSILMPIVVERGLFSECVAYRNVTVFVSTSYDFRDELYQEEIGNVSTEHCSNHQWMCRTGFALVQPSTRCIDRRQRCNRLIDCDDQSDEALCNEFVPLVACPKGYSECSDRRSCYRKIDQTCDGCIHCLDGSDEQNCTRDQCRLHRRVFCPQENRCAQRENSDYCDGIVDCEDGSDEHHCEKCSAQINVFLCDSKCFLSNYRCDDTVQCSDFRDEINCMGYGPDYRKQRNFYHTDRLCVEQRFNPLEFFPPKFEPSLEKSVEYPNQRLQHLTKMHCFKLIVFYGVMGGLLSITLSIVSLILMNCCHYQYRYVSIYFYGLFILSAFALISAALIVYVFIWYLKRTIVTDHDITLPFDLMLHQRNESLRYIEFFAWSFWLACAAALTTLIAFLFSCCVCCTILSSRADDKEYEIIQIGNY